MVFTVQFAQKGAHVIRVQTWEPQRALGRTLGWVSEGSKRQGLSEKNMVLPSFILYIYKYIYANIYICKYVLCTIIGSIK